MVVSIRKLEMLELIKKQISSELQKEGKVVQKEIGSSPELPSDPAAHPADPAAIPAEPAALPTDPSALPTNLAALSLGSQEKPRRHCRE